MARFPFLESVMKIILYIDKFKNDCDSMLDMQSADRKSVRAFISIIITKIMIQGGFKTILDYAKKFYVPCLEQMADQQGDALRLVIEKLSTGGDAIGCDFTGLPTS